MHTPSIALVTLSLATLARGQDPCGTWTSIAIPDPPSSSHTVVEDVSVLAPDLAWAVGRKYVPAGSGAETQTVAWRWDGAAWTIVPSPSPSPYPGGGWADFQAVEVLSASEAWAAGGQRIQAPDGYLGTHLMVQRWNGSQWSLVPSPITIGGSGNFVDDIEVVAPDEVWFVGDWLSFPPTSATQKRALAMRWNGSSFEVHDTPFFDTADGHGLTAVSAVAADDVWAVGGGHDGDYVGYSYIVHWDGAAWQHRPGPAPGWFQRLWDVEAVSAEEVWAVGDYQDASGYHGLALRWDGSSWTQLPDPPVGGSSIEVLAGGEVYVGGGGIARWNGAGWDVVATFAGVSSPSILALDEIGSCEVWGVGRRIAGELEPLAVRLDPSPPLGTRVCATTPNSAGPGATVSATGSTSLAADDLVLHGAGAPALKSSLFFYGDQQVSVPFGNGVRCAGGTLARTGVTTTDAGGSVTQAFDYAGSPIAPGGAWIFQLWFRDPAAGGANFDASDAISIVFGP